MAKEFVLTKKGKTELEEQLAYLKTVRRVEVSAQIKEARSFGDLSENAEYTEARNEQSRVEGKILDIENILRLATIVDDNEVSLDKVAIGTKVRIFDKELNAEEEYQIMGSMETKAAANIISNESPVGEALLGKAVGEEVEVQTPHGAIHLTVLEIARAD